MKALKTCNNTLLKHSKPKSKDEPECDAVNVRLYRSMIVSLMFDQLQGQIFSLADAEFLLVALNVPTARTTPAGNVIDSIDYLISLKLNNPLSTNVEDRFKLVWSSLISHLQGPLKLHLQKIDSQASDLKAQQAESDLEEEEEQDVDPLIKLAKVAATAADNSAVPTGSSNEDAIPPSSSIPSDAFVGGSTIPPNVHANQGLSANLLGPDVNEDNFAARMVALVAERRRKFDAQ
ncbi:hypothetical protein Tco_1402272 [Tanacetum coccineum]